MKPAASKAYLQNQTVGLNPVDYIPLVRKIAYQLHCKLPSHVDIEDLIQTGYIGLTQSLNRFSSEGGAQFETFASLRIRGAMLDYLRQEDLLPHHLRNLSKKIDQACIKLQHTLHRQPTDEEIASFLHISLEDISSSRQLSEQAHFLTFDDLGLNPEDHLSDSSFDPSQSLLFKQLLQRLSSFIESLSRNEQLVLSLHYDEELPFKDIASVLDLSEPRISQLHSQAIQKIKQHLASS